MPKVTFKNTGATAEVPAGTPLKEVTRNNNWTISFGCEEGSCGTCLVKVVEGNGNLGPMEEKEKETLSAMGLDLNVYRLTCQCKVNGDVIIEQ